MDPQNPHRLAEARSLALHREVARRIRDELREGSTSWTADSSLSEESSGSLGPDRLVPINTPGTRGATGWCISVADLVVSKYVAGREKDRSYVRAALAHGLVGATEILALLAVTPIDAAHRTMLETLVRADAKVVATAG